MIAQQRDPVPNLSSYHQPEQGQEQLQHHNHQQGHVDEGLYGQHGIGSSSPPAPSSSRAPPSMVPTDPAESSAQGSAAAAAAAASLSRANSRSQAIAKLKRAASQREMRSRAPTDTGGRDNERLSPPQDQGQWAPSAPASNGGHHSPQDDHDNDAEDEGDDEDEEEQGGPSDFRSRSTSPAVSRGGYGGLPQNRLPQDFLRPAAASPTPPASHLVRSRSRQDRSPLPSLEQLRARILQERETAGLQRSASASEASKAARNYALNKLLGKSFREGAVSPASEGEGDEDASDSGAGHETPAPADPVASRAEMRTPPPVKGYEPSSPSRRMSVIQKQKAMLRRSRTIGGLSAMAERQRKEAFVAGSTLQVPADGAPRRSSRWFVHGGPARQASGSQAGSSNGGDQPTATPAPPSLSRQPSQREIARTEMMRKLSGRRLPGAATQPAVAPAKDLLSPQSAQQAPSAGPTLNDGAISPHSPLKSLGASHGSENQSASTGALLGSGGGLAPLASPGMQRAFLSPSPAGGPPSSAGYISPSYMPPSPHELKHRSSSASSYAHSAHSNLTARYIQERDRASALARAEGEEAFLYDDMMGRGLSRMGSTTGHDEDESGYISNRSPFRSPAASTRPLSEEHPSLQPGQGQQQHEEGFEASDELEQATLRGSADRSQEWHSADAAPGTAVPIHHHDDDDDDNGMDDQEPHEYLASASEILRDQASPAVPINDASPSDDGAPFDGPSRPWMLQDSGRVASSASIPLALGSAPLGTLTFGDSEDEDRIHRVALSTPLLGQGTPNSRSSGSERWPRSVASKETLGNPLRSSSDQAGDDRRHAATPEGIPSSTFLTTPGRSPGGPSRGPPLSLDPNAGQAASAQRLLSPSFVNEFGNPLDYVRSPSSAGGSPQMPRGSHANSPAQPSPSPSARRTGTGLSTADSEMGYWDLTDWDEAGTPIEGENDSSSEDGGEDLRERALPPLPTFTTTQHQSPRMLVVEPEAMRAGEEERGMATADLRSSAATPPESHAASQTMAATEGTSSREGPPTLPRGVASPTPSELGNSQIPQRSSSLSKRISLMNNAFRSGRHAKNPSSASVLSNASTVNGTDYMPPQASSAELPALYANSKLTPFPGLFEQANAAQSQPTPPPQSLPTAGPPLSISRPAAKGIAPLAIFGDRSLGKAVNASEVSSSASVTPSTEASNDGQTASAAESDVTASRPARVLSPKFFSSLRRKASGAMSSSTSSKDKESGERRTSPTRRFFDGLPQLHGRKPSRDGLSSFKPVLRPSQEDKAKADDNDIPIQIIGPMTDGADLSRASSVASQLAARNAAPSRSIMPVHHEGDLSGQVDSGLASPPKSSAGFTATSSLAPSTAAMLHRYSHILTSPTDAAMLAPTVPGLTPAIIANPPRKLLHSGPVLQVVTNNTVKDRFLFLFSDILVIAKPAAPPLPSPTTSTRSLGQQAAAGRSRRGDAAELPTLKWSFEVKNIVELHAVKLSLQVDSRRGPPRRLPLMQTFVRQFSESPEAALSHIIAQSGLPKQPSTIAQLLQQTPELDRERLTQYLCAPATGRVDVLSAYIEAQRLTGVSVESALRSLLLSLRFPRDPNTFETLLTTFAREWTRANQASIKPLFTAELAINLVFAIMALNDALHGADPRSQAPGLFSDPLPTLSRSAFLSAFRTHDPDAVLSDRTLLRIYASIDSDPIAQALGRDEPGERLPLRVESPGLPAKLAYGVASAPITVTIPRPDPEFTIRLYGQDLTFDPPILNFEEGASQTFRMTSKSLGTKHAVFVRAGRTAKYYVASTDETASGHGLGSDLPFSSAITVERAFMQNRFTLTMANAGGGAATTKRRYMFSVDDETTLRFWAQHLERGIEVSAAEMARLNAGVKRIVEANADKAASALVQQAQVRLAAHSLALHVLKETLISAETPAASATNGSSALLQRSASSVVQRPVVTTLSRAPSDSRFAGRSLGAPQTDMTRNQSISRHYYAGAGRGERELLPDPPASAASSNGRWPPSNVAGPAAAPSSPGDRARAIEGPVPGDALVLTCAQNSLLPLVLDALTKKV